MLYTNDGLILIRQVEGIHKSVKMEKVVWFMKLAEHYQLDDVHEKAMDLAIRTPSEPLQPVFL
jgi:hypothetical protein